jgi:hypothetical protein
MALRYRLDLFPRPLALVLAGALLAGCGSLTPELLEAPPAKIPPLPTVAEADSALSLYDVEVGTPSLMTTEMAVRARLDQAHAAWDGTPYRFGGNTTAGTDCSGFVQRVFTDFFGMALTRATHSQVTEGVAVDRGSLQPGDLVFFQTGRRQRHVGVYIGNNRFLHSSTRRGVTIDSIDGYYDRTYWTSRRVLTEDVLAAVRSDFARVAQNSTPSRVVMPPPVTSREAATRTDNTARAESARSDAGAPRLRNTNRTEPSRTETTRSSRERHAGW